MKLMNRNQYDEHYFENFAYREKPNSQRNRRRLEEILKFKKKGRLLEVGCGKGEFIKMADEHFEITGVDVSEYAVQSLKETFGDQVRQANIEDAQLRVGHYDVVVLFNVLEHLKKPGDVTRKVHESLTKHGLFIGSVPYNASLVGRFHTAITNFFDRTHCSTYPPDRWRAVFRKAGFRNIHFFGEVMIGRNFSFYLRHRLWPHLSLNLVFLCEK